MLNAAEHLSSLQAEVKKYFIPFPEWLIKAKSALETNILEIFDPANTSSNIDYDKGSKHLAFEALLTLENNIEKEELCRQYKTLWYRLSDLSESEEFRANQNIVLLWSFIFKSEKLRTGIDKLLAFT